MTTTSETTSQRAGPPEPVPFQPGSLLWDTIGLRTSVLAANSAFILQVMHPSIGTVVDQRSRSRVDPVGRAARSFASVQTWVYGGQAVIEEDLRLREMHKPLSAVDEEERPRCCVRSRCRPAGRAAGWPASSPWAPCRPRRARSSGCRGVGPTNCPARGLQNDRRHHRAASGTLALHADRVSGAAGRAGATAFRRGARQPPPLTAAAHHSLPDASVVRRPRTSAAEHGPVIRRKVGRRRRGGPSTTRQPSMAPPLVALAPGAGSRRAGTSRRWRCARQPTAVALLIAAVLGGAGRTGLFIARMAAVAGGRRVTASAPVADHAHGVARGVDERLRSCSPGKRRRLPGAWLGSVH